MKHHAYANDPEKDPDYNNAHAKSLLCPMLLRLLQMDHHY